MLLIPILLMLAVVVLLIAAFWRVFSKAGQPGWAAIVPIYNTLVLLRIVGRPWWWLLLMLIPFVNVVLVIIVYVDLAKSFGKGSGFAVCLIFFAYVCIPILGFGDAVYLGPAAAAGAQPLYPGQPYRPQQYPGQPYMAPQYPPPGQQYQLPQHPGPQYPGQQQYSPQYPGQQQYPPQYPGQQQYPPQYPGQRQYPPL
jgi:hypothetical protein